MTEDTAKIISFNKRENKCSFCKRPESQCKYFWSNGNGQSICDHCIKHCSKLIKDDTN